MATPFKVLVKTPFSMFSGYGQDGYGLTRALMKWGCDVYVQPQHVDVPIPQDLLHLFGKPLDPPFDLTINHWDPENLRLDRHARECTRVAVAWTMWEFSSLIPHCRNRRTLRERLEWYDLILGYDAVSVEAMRPWVPKVIKRTHPESGEVTKIKGPVLGKLQGGFESSEWKPLERDWFGSRFCFGMHGALNNRKQPYKVLAAFRALKDEHPIEFEDACLLLHTTCPPLFPEIGSILEQLKVEVFYEVWDKPTLTEFYKSCHALVYPSMGEGKNLPALEMLATGGAVIATNWSGHTEWLSENVGWPLPYELKPLFPVKYPDAAQYAEVPVEAIKAAMWDAFTNRGEARQRGEMGAKLIPQMCDWSVIVENLFRLIRDNVPRAGEVVFNMAQEARRNAP
jgi:glycosyltransferase involved in cell wall biosynthesis